MVGMGLAYILVDVFFSRTINIENVGYKTSHEKMDPMKMSPFVPNPTMKAVLNIFSTPKLYRQQMQ